MSGPGWSLAPPLSPGPAHGARPIHLGLRGGIDGRQMADAARANSPGLKVLFMTGYAENTAVGTAILTPAWRC